MAAITTIALTSPVTQAAAPCAFGQGFKKGDVPAGQYVVADTANFAVQPLATWNDGSLKHAKIIVRKALTANVASTITLSTSSTAPTGTALTTASITAAAPTASVQCGALGTVTLASLLASPVRAWISTPEMVEGHYKSAIAGTNLMVWFYVQLYADGRCKVVPIVENGYVDNGSGAAATNADIAYVPTITVGGVVIYDNGGASLTHLKLTRYKKEGWIGGDPQVTPTHNKAYLRSSALMPNYSYYTPDETALAALVQTVAPMSNGPIPAAMGGGGANSSIGLLPRWDSVFARTDDPRAYRAVLAGSDALNAFAICFRDSTTKDVLKPSAFANWSNSGPGGSGSAGVNLSNGNNWEINHHPGCGYTAYLITGDYWHYETLMLQVSTLYILRGNTTTGPVVAGNGISRIIVHETRGAAWSIRTMSLACAIMPDVQKTAGAVGAEYRTMLASNMVYWKGVTQTPGINQLGALYEYTVTGYGSTDGWAPPWQTLWWVGAQGFGSDIEPLANMTDYLVVRDWMYKYVVGLGGPVTTGFPYELMSAYTVRYENGASLNPNAWGPTWRDVATLTFSHLADGVGSITDINTLLNGGNYSIGDPVPAVGGAGGVESAADGRYGYLMPALAYAVEHGAVGAPAVWSRVTGASNYSTLTGAFTSNVSQWNIFPRTIGATSVTHAQGPVIRFGRLRAGRITISKYHGFGIPKSAVASGHAVKSVFEDQLAGDPSNMIYGVASIAPPDSGVFTLNEDGSGSLAGAANGVRTASIIITKWGVVDGTQTIEFDVGVVTTQVSADLAGSYAIANLVRADLAAVYSIAGGGLVSSDFVASYGINGFVSADLAAAYQIARFVSADLNGTYAIQTDIAYTRAPAGNGYHPARLIVSDRPANH